METNPNTDPQIARAVSDTFKERLEALSSVYPPTNQTLLARWRQEFVNQGEHQPAIEFIDAWNRILEYDTTGEPALEEATNKLVKHCQSFC